MSNSTGIDHSPNRAGSVDGPAEQSELSASVVELIAISAAVAANCEPCFKFHYDAARKLGVSDADLQTAVRIAQKVKAAPGRAMTELTERILSAGWQSDTSRKHP